jgi:hypothetical protein
MPSSTRICANSEETAAATIPRGPSQAMKPRSRHPRPLPAVDTSTPRGRTTSMIAAAVATPGQPSRITEESRTSAASSTNSSPMNRAASCRSNPARRRPACMDALPTNRPAITAATMPLSDRTAFPSW